MWEGRYGGRRQSRQVPADDDDPNQPPQSHFPVNKVVVAGGEGGVAAV